MKITKADIGRWVIIVACGMVVEFKILATTRHTMFGKVRGKALHALYYKRQAVRFKK